MSSSNFYLYVRCTGVVSTVLRQNRRHQQPPCCRHPRNNNTQFANKLFTNLQQILQSQHTLNPNLFFTNLTGSATNVGIGQGSSEVVQVVRSVQGRPRSSRGRPRSSTVVQGRPHATSGPMSLMVPSPLVHHLTILPYPISWHLI